MVSSSLFMDKKNGLNRNTKHCMFAWPHPNLVSLESTLHLTCIPSIHCFENVFLFPLPRTYFKPLVHKQRSQPYFYAQACQYNWKWGHDPRSGSWQTDVSEIQNSFWPLLTPLKSLVVWSTSWMQWEKMNLHSPSLEQFGWTLQLSAWAVVTLLGSRLNS